MFVGLETRQNKAIKDINSKKLEITGYELELHLGILLKKYLEPSPNVQIFYTKTTGFVVSWHRHQIVHELVGEYVNKPEPYPFSPTCYWKQLYIFSVLLSSLTLYFPFIYLKLLSLLFCSFIFSLCWYFLKLRKYVKDQNNPNRHG